MQKGRIKDKAEDLQAIEDSWLGFKWWVLEKK